MTKILFDDKERVYTINEVAEITGLHPQTLRNWEKASLLSPQRISGNQRVFQKKDLEMIEKICELKDKGFNLQAIKHTLLNENN